MTNGFFLSPALGKVGYIDEPLLRMFSMGATYGLARQYKLVASIDFQQ